MNGITPKASGEGLQSSLFLVSACLLSSFTYNCCIDVVITEFNEIGLWLNLGKGAICLFCYEFAWLSSIFVLRAKKLRGGLCYWCWVWMKFVRFLEKTDEHLHGVHPCSSFGHRVKFLKRWKRLSIWVYERYIEREFWGVRTYSRPYAMLLITLTRVPRGHPITTTTHHESLPFYHVVFVSNERRWANLWLPQPWWIRCTMGIFLGIFLGLSITTTLSFAISFLFSLLSFHIVFFYVWIVGFWPILSFLSLAYHSYKQTHPSPCYLFILLHYLY